MRFTFRAMQATDVDEIVTWRYDPPYGEYDPAHSQTDVDEMRAAVGSPNWFVAVGDEGRPSGFVVARVGEEDGEVVVEAGLGLRPDLTGKGIGPGFVEDVVELVRERWAPRTMVLDVLPWNERAMRAYEKAGFSRFPAYERTFEDGNVVTFVPMRRTF